MNDQRGQRAIVTGAAGVIGRACCRRLLADGYRILAVDRDKDAGGALVDELASGGELVSHAADVTIDLDVEGYAREAVSRFGGVDAFFNNAGIEGAVAPIVDYPVETFDQVVAVNLRGVFLGLKHVMRIMTESSGGAIVNTASIAGLVGFGGLAPYIASKHAVAGLTKVAALESATSSVRVNAVCPGPVESRMMGSLHDQAGPMLGLPDADAVRAAMTQMVPVGRYAKPEEVADLVAYLLSDRASYISGAAIPIDWGWTAR